MKLPAQIFHMNEGDTLHIEADRASDKDYFSDMTFCITLTTWDCIEVLDIDNLIRFPSAFDEALLELPLKYPVPCSSDLVKY